MHYFSSVVLPLAVFSLQGHLAPETRTPQLDPRHLQTFSRAQLRSCLRSCVHVAWRDACRSRVTSTRNSKTTARTYSSCFFRRLHEAASGRRRDALLEIARSHAQTARIERVWFHDSFPVDVRHNAKIHRPQLAEWAAARPPA